MQIEFKENQVVVWVMESPRIFRKYGQELMAQANGTDGGFVLSHGNNILDIGQKLEVILTPYGIELNDKKCMNKIYAELKNLAYSEQYYMETQSILSQIHNYLIALEQDACVDLAYTEPDLAQVLKAFGVRVDDAECGLLSKMSQYLKIAVKLLDKKVVVFVNLTFYMEESEIEKLLREAFYLKIAVVLIEQRELSFSVDTKCYIIDNDNCEIF